MDKAEASFQIINSRKLDRGFINDMRCNKNEVKKLEPVFNKFFLPACGFSSYIENTFDKDTALKVVEAFHKMGLPLPQGEEFLKGQEGFLVFLNKYGVIIRIEKPDTEQEFRSERINDNGGVLKPFASVEAGLVTIELCAGLRPETKLENNEHLQRQLKNDGIEFWDYKLSNTGRLPVKTARFPEGIPVVIDRGAVRRLTDSLKPVRESLFAKSKPVGEALLAVQEQLYAPLHEAFEAGWVDAAKMKNFWELCQRYLQQEKLFAGWNEDISLEARSEKCRYGDNFKNKKAAYAAKKYEARLQGSLKQRPAGAVPQIHRPSTGITV